MKAMMIKHKSRRSSKWFAAMVLALGIPVSASAGVIYNTDFSELTGWDFSGNRTTKVTAAPDGDGTAARFVLNRKDPVTFRSELVHITGEVPDNIRNAEPGKEYWYGFKVWLDEYSKDSSSDVVFQFHGSADPGCPTKRSPLLTLRVRGADWAVSSVGDSRRCIGREARPWQNWMDQSIGKYETGRWTHFVFRVKWSHKSDGILEVWKDGKKVISRRSATMFNDQRGPNLKLGIYKPDWSSIRSRTNRRSLYYGSLRIAKGANLMEAVSTLTGPTGGTPAAPQGLSVDVTPAPVAEHPLPPIDDGDTLPPIGPNDTAPEPATCVRCDLLQERGGLSIMR